jgi:hypothetical protein
MKAIHQTVEKIRRVTCRCLCSALAVLAGFSGSAWAGSFELDDGLFAGLNGRYTLTLGYGLAVRTKSPADALVNGPIDPQTGLPTTINFDDGDRNFKKGGLVNNRATALAELFLSRDGYGLVLRGDGFYDSVYRRRNHNDSPATVNKSGAHDEFTPEAKNFSGARARVLDAYIYGDWTLGDSMNLNVRLGSQVVAWGETLFFSGVAAAQGPADATKINLPGVEVKSILLPIEQIAANLGVTDDLSLMAYYRLRYRPTELEPVGGYFSTVDIVGPGAQFAYGFVNPFYDPLANPGAFTPAQFQSLLTTLFPNGVPQTLPATLAGRVPGAKPIINIPRDPDVLPRNGGQWGAGLKYQLTSATNVGLYWLRYHDTLPVVHLTPGFPELATGVTTSPTPAPVSYNITYFDGIKLGAISFSSKLGDVSVAGELIYRDGVNVLVNGQFGPTSTRGKVSQAFLSGIYLVPPNFISQQIDLVGEAGYIHVNHVTPLDGSDQLVNSRDAWGFSAIANFNYRNAFPKWDLALPVTLAALVKGTPAMAGAMGSLYGEGDTRASVAANFTYLQNLQYGISYNAFLGSPNLSKRPYSDRDYAAITVKYSF